MIYTYPEEGIVYRLPKHQGKVQPYMSFANTRNAITANINLLPAKNAETQPSTTILRAFSPLFKLIEPFPKEKIISPTDFSAEEAIILKMLQDQRRIRTIENKGFEGIETF